MLGPAPFLPIPYVHHIPQFRYSFTCSIARSAKRRYLSYSEADFEVFAQLGRHVAPIGMKVGMKEGFGMKEGTMPNLVWRRGLPSSMPNFTPIGATIRV